MIGTLRRAGISLGRIRAALDRAATRTDAATRGSGYDVRRYAVYADELYIQYADGSWEGDRRPGQLVLDGMLPLRPIDVALVSAPSARSARSTVTRPAPPVRSLGRIAPVDPIAAARPIVPADVEAIRRFLAIQDRREPHPDREPVASAGDRPGHPVGGEEVEDGAGGVEGLPRG